MSDRYDIAASGFPIEISWLCGLLRLYSHNIAHGAFDVWLDQMLKIVSEITYGPTCALSII